MRIANAELAYCRRETALKYNERSSINKGFLRVYMLCSRVLWHTLFVSWIRWGKNTMELSNGLVCLRDELDYLIQVVGDFGL